MRPLWNPLPRAPSDHVWRGKDHGIEEAKPLRCCTPTAATPPSAPAAAMPPPHPRLQRLNRPDPVV